MAYMWPTSQYIAAEWKTCGFWRKKIKISNGTCSLMTRNISCNQMRKITFIWMLALDSSRHTFHQWAQHHMVGRPKPCWTVTIGVRADSCVWNFPWTTKRVYYMRMQALDSNRCTFHQWAQHHMVGRSKACGTVTMGVRVDTACGTFHGLRREYTTWECGHQPQIIAHFTSEHSTTWFADQKLVGL